jgi:hypothetical protein
MNDGTKKLPCGSALVFKYLPRRTRYKAARAQWIAARISETSSPSCPPLAPLQARPLCPRHLRGLGIPRETLTTTGRPLTMPSFTRITLECTRFKATEQHLLLLFLLRCMLKRRIYELSLTKSSSLTEAILEQPMPVKLSDNRSAATQVAASRPIPV